MRRLPYSLLFFAASIIVFVLQLIPVTGVFLMLVLAVLWSVALVNAGMIGVALEAAAGRVSRWWLVLPLAFYGGYWAFAALDHITLWRLTGSYDAANARVVTGFDPASQALVFEKDGSGAWLTQNYALPVVYSVNANFPEGYLSHRLMDSGACKRARSPEAQAAFVHAFGFHDGDAVGSRHLERRFCSLSMPERPDLPMVRVMQQESRTQVGSLPIRRTVTTITMPDGRRFELLGGVASPLKWLPMPMTGCGLNSGAAKWQCFAGFRRDDFTPIVSGDTRYRRDEKVLAGALELQPVAIGDRKGSDPDLILKKIAAVADATLARQLANVDAMIADPLVKADWQVGVVSAHPDILVSRAEAIMTGVERAAAITGKDFYRARESGRILARLLADLPPNGFLALGPRILAVYARADDKHWLWEAESLLRRLGDLGADALPFLVNPQASRPSVNYAGVEGLCRVGAAGRDVAGPVLLGLWDRGTAAGTLDERTALFVAMRRVGLTPPLIPDDKRGLFAALQAEWADISPQSPASVCDIRAERQARRQAKRR